ncbi:hypothetical protein GCM10025767_29920 [Thalassotalea piscium]
MIFLAYSNSFLVPFLFDDITSIVEKQKVYIEGFSAIYQEFGQRLLVYLTFYGNYQLHQLDVWGYHLVNTCIHLISAFFVYLLTLEILKANQILVLKERAPLLNIQWFALLVCLLFALHPLQTQAVTYIVQRTTSLAALFYIATMFSYFKFRFAEKHTHKTVMFIATFALFVLAVLTKQNTYTLPGALLVLEIIFIYPILRYSPRIPLIIGACLTVVMAISLLIFPEIVIALDAASKETTDFTRLAYFESQLTILVHYITLFIYPVNLQVEYIYPLADGNLLDSIGYLFAYAVAISVAFFYRRKEPILAFAIIFFFIAHAVESSFIPISDLVFEHRTYLPNLSLCLLAIFFLQKIASKQLFTVKVVTLLIIVVLAYLTYQRNEVWSDPEKLYANELKINDNKPRIYASLGDYYRLDSKHKLSADNYKKAYELTGEFNDLDNQGFDAKFGYFNNYIAALSRAGENKEAIAVTLQLLPQLKGSKFLPIIYTNLGSFYWQEKNYLHCTKYMFQAMKLKPNMIEPVIGVGKCFEEMGDKEMALHMFNKARKLSQ